jgi:hypothetical protein
VSTSSTPTAESPDADPLIALGERILTELGDPRTNSTLARWLSHHTARLIREADEARQAGAEDTGTREAEAREAILNLWQARTTWPAGWPPPRAAEIVRHLDDLPRLDDENRWHRPTVLTHLQDLHHHILAVLVDLATSDEADIEQGWLDTFGDHLNPDEALLLHRAATRPRRIESLLRWWDHTEDNQAEQTSDADAEGEDSGPIPPVHPLLALADAYRETITDLIQPAADKPEDCEADAGTNQASKAEQVTRLRILYGRRVTRVFAARRDQHRDFIHGFLIQPEQEVRYFVTVRSGPCNEGGAAAWRDCNV